MIELRLEPPDAPAGRALYAEYLALVRERLPGYTPSDAIHGSTEAIGEWVVVYEDGEPVACGGLAGNEIKRMFVRPDRRGRGHGRRLLAELERRARAGGARSVRLYTTDVLAEAIRLYRAAGYRHLSTQAVEGRRDHWFEKEIA